MIMTTMAMMMMASAEPSAITLSAALFLAAFMNIRALFGAQDVRTANASESTRLLMSFASS